MTIAFILLYVAGALTVFILSLCLVCLGGRTPRPNEWLPMLIFIFLWPIAVPLMAVKLFYRVFCK
jgi:hypothetical protein